MVGAGATTISYSDLMGSDLIVLFGSDVANAQPVVMKYLYLARKGGTKVAVVNPYREPGLESYWVPSNAESAVFGTTMTDEFFAVNIGGDIAFITGVMKVLAATGGLDEAFIAGHTTGFPELAAALDDLTFGDLELLSGATRADMERFAAMYAGARSAVLVWSMGLTQHAFGSENVRAVINLALARGYVGREGAGLMPIRGHSGVQGGAEMGAYATALPGGVAPRLRIGRRASERVGLRRADRPRPDGARDGRGGAARRARRPLLVRRQLPRHAARPGARGRRCSPVPVRVHQDIVVTSQMLVDPGEVVVLLPAATRYEQRDGGTADHHRAAHRLQSPRCPARRSARRAPSGRSSASWPRASSPDARAPDRDPVRAGHPRGDRPGRAALRRHRDAAGARATRCSGAGRGSATGATSRRPTAARASPSRRAPAATRARGAPCALHPPRQAVQLDGLPRARPAHRGGARRPVHRGRGRRAPRRGRGRSPGGALRVGRGPRPRPRGARCAPATSRCSSPSATH